MTAKMSVSIRGRIALSQRAWTLPDGSPLGWWSLAPAGDPGGDRHAREAARQIPTEYRETAWLRDAHGRTWWALLDTRTDRAAYASTRDEMPEDVAEPAAVTVEPEPLPDAIAPDAEPAVEPTDEPEALPAAIAAEPPEPEPAPAVETEPTKETPAMPDQSRALVAALRNFEVSADVADVTRGATVDRYMLKPGPGVRVSQVAKLADDLALALDVPHVRVLPASGHVAVEVPAAERSTVTLADVAAGLEHDHPLRVPVGVDVAGHGISARLDRLPHLLVAGTTGSGKSTWTSAVLAHVATHAAPRDVQLALIDPKRVELAPFAGLPHLWRPVATDVERAVEVLEALVEEIEGRYSRLEVAGRRTIEDLDDRPPYLLLVVDELADLMMTAGKRAESALVRILQIGRAAGVHAILATQRPSADVVTPLIKANTPSRLAFAVQSHVDSGVALGQSGAEGLLGAGDGLWWPSGASQPERVQAPYVGSEELEEMLSPLRRSEDVRAERLQRLEEVRRVSISRHFEDMPEPASVSTPPVPPEPVPDYASRELAMMRQHAREIEEAVEMAYAKGRRHGQLAMELPAHRPMIGRDWRAALVVGLLATLLAFVILPALVPAFGAWAGWAVARRRTSMALYRGIPAAERISL